MLFNPAFRLLELIRQVREVNSPPLPNLKNKSLLLLLCHFRPMENMAQP